MLLSSIKQRVSYNLFFSSLNAIYRNYFQVRRSKFGYIDPAARVRFPILIKGIGNVFLYENTHILGHSKIISTHARFIMKRNSASAEGLTVVTGNHPSKIGEWFFKIAADDIQEAKDVIVNEDVWIGANVTLLAGCVIGRGAVIGNGAVCRKQVPPYAVVVGNPAKIIGFRFSPHETVEHEAILYDEADRIPLTALERNYKLHFSQRLAEISSAIRL